MEAIGEFKLAGVTWGNGDCSRVAKLIELVIKKEGEKVENKD